MGRKKKYKKRKPPIHTQRKPYEKGLPVLYGPQTYWIPVSEYIKLHGIGERHFYQNILPQGRVIYKMLKGQYFIDSRYPPFEHTSEIKPRNNKWLDLEQ